MFLEKFRSYFLQEAWRKPKILSFQTSKLCHFTKSQTYKITDRHKYM